MNRYSVLVGKPERKRPLGRPRRRCVDNIKTILQEVGCGYMNWIWLAQDRDRWRTLVSAVMNLGVPWNAGNFLTSCKPVSCSRRNLHRGLSKWAWKLNLIKGSRHVRPITESQTVQGHTCTDTIGHETSRKFCLRNTALLVMYLTALW